MLHLHSERFESRFHVDVSNNVKIYAEAILNRQDYVSYVSL